MNENVTDAMPTAARSTWSPCRPITAVSTTPVAAVAIWASTTGHASASTRRRVSDSPDDTAGSLTRPPYSEQIPTSS